MLLPLAHFDALTVGLSQNSTNLKRQNFINELRVGLGSGDLRVVFGTVKPVVLGEALPMVVHLCFDYNVP